MRAHHLSTGYPALQAGAGLLPGDWAEHVRLLTGHGFRLTDRYYALQRPLQTLVEETLPLANLSLARHHSTAGDLYDLYHRRTEPVGHARLIRVQTDASAKENGARAEGAQADGIKNDDAAQAKLTQQLAYVAEFAIEPDWQRRSIGRWLLRRLINDCTLQGYDEMLIHLPQRATPALNLFNLHGFLEQNYRGYTLEKEL